MKFGNLVKLKNCSADILEAAINQLTCIPVLLLGQTCRQTNSYNTMKSHYILIFCC